MAGLGFLRTAAKREDCLFIAPRKAAGRGRPHAAEAHHFLGAPEVVTGAASDADLGDDHVAELLAPTSIAARRGRLGRLDAGRLRVVW